MIRFDFKNDKERKRFLKEYKSWGIWFVETRTQTTYYRCQLPTGEFVVVEKQPDIIRKYGTVEFPTKRERYHMYKNEYDMLEERETQILGVLHSYRGVFDVKTADDLNVGDTNA